MGEWTEREIGICIISLLTGFCIGAVLGIVLEHPDCIEFKVGDEEYFGITNNEKWGDLQNKQAIQEFTLFYGYDTYKMVRYTNGDQFCNNDVLNPLDAYILMEKNNNDIKEVHYREYKEWLLNIERMNAGV